MWSAPPPVIEDAPAPSAEEAETGPDSYQLAQEAARSGRLEDAMDILGGEIARQSSGRGRFERKLQLAQICLGAGQPDIARAVLTELADAIEEHRLETWESAEVVAHALSLLYSCTDLELGAKAQLYARICRLSPVQALRHGAQAFAHGR
jgi:type VI secretion system protein ImpA